jgi:hypothetical protein
VLWFGSLSKVPAATAGEYSIIRIIRKVRRRGEEEQKGKGKTRK